MTYTVQKLITNAFYISQIKGKGYQTVTSDEVADGLDSLNDLLSEKTVDVSMNPYYSQYTFSGVIGQETYNVPSLIYGETLTFTLNSVRYPMVLMGRDEYYGSARANNINSLPFIWHQERELSGSDVSVYFSPDQAYSFELWGKFGLAAVTQFQDLELTYDRFYISYLKYELTQRLCLDFGYDVPAGVQRRLLDFNSIMAKQMSPLDLKTKKISTLDSSTSINFAAVNLGNGWGV